MRKIPYEKWFGSKLQEWYASHKRSLPWRATTDPYRIWISEIILQQTRVDQGLPYYNRFIANFSDVKQLAEASEDQVLRHWQGLGYYSRAKNLHATAKTITTAHRGVFPKSYDELLKLKGIGPYTAAAIASFAYKQPHAVVDGNVFRVLSRVFGIETPINSSAGEREFSSLAQSLINLQHPDLHNQAIMEFGALQCIPKNPQCDRCIFASRCSALASNKVDSLPVKLKKTRVKKRCLHYFSVEDVDQKQRVIKRGKDGLWSGLYEFPSVELEHRSEVTDELIHELFGAVRTWGVVDETPIIHKLSHQELWVYLYRVQLKDKDEQGVTVKVMKELPVSTLMQKLMNRLNFYYL
ncbi:MAG: hypothetical protein RLZZ242_633 [Bacteroidota bacterium]|jgi:A/G-specific adenine glycosylase